MIAKRIQNKSAGNSFKRLAAYVVNAQNAGRGDPTEWKLADYILDKKHGGEKVASVRATNCISDDPRWAVSECVALAAQNTRSQRDKAYHLVVSFPEGERPTPEQMIDIEDEVVRSIGLQDHKRISAIHQNTDNWHLHVAICTVHPKTFRNATPYYDHLRLQEACQALELKHGLQRDNHSRTPEKPLEGKAVSLRLHADRIALAAWVQEHAAPAIKQAGQTAKSWQALHAALAEDGLVVRKRGAGLVIAHRDSTKIRIKASEVDRTFTMKRLTDRLGDYQAAGEIPAATRAYVSQTANPTPGTEFLWKRYQDQQAAKADAKEQALIELRGQQLEYAHDLDAWYRKRFAAAAAQHLSRADRTRTFRTLASQQKKDRQERRERERGEREVVKAEHAGTSWGEFLEAATARGDRAAAQAIERRIARDNDRGHGR